MRRSLLSLLVVTLATILYFATRSAKDEGAPLSTDAPTAPAPDVDASGVRVAGVVKDEGGAPLAGVRVAPSWSLEEGVPVARDALVTDEQGRFAGPLVGWYQDSFTLVAYDADGGRSGMVRVEKGAASDLEIVTQSTVRVHGRVTCRELGVVPKWIHCYWTQDGEFTIACESTDGRFETRLPPGEWGLELYDQYFTTHDDVIDVPTTATELDLGEIDLPASFIARHEGKPLPEWTVTEARGVALEKSRLEDFRGKWILLEFWGHW